MHDDLYVLFLKKYGEFTDIQKASLPVVESGKNCLIIAPTGSGKTEASLLPIMKKIFNSERKSKTVSAIYITPLRALNRDLIKRLEWLGSGSGISISVRHGDTSQKERKLQAASPPDIFITTPESLQNLFMSQSIREAIKGVKYVIVDELHELYYNKRGAQLSIALERLAEICGDFQRVGVSATIGEVSLPALFLFNKRDYKIVDIKKIKSYDIIIEMPYHTPEKNKAFAETFALDGPAYARINRIVDLIKESKSTLVFANTRQVVESLGSKLTYFNKVENFGSIGIHHGSIDKEERIVVENQFKEGKIRSIIATSSLELGIDIGSIDLVVQYGSPRQATRLIQRVGRGGHKQDVTSKGRVLVPSFLECLESVAITHFALNGGMEKHKIEQNALDVLMNQICSITLEYKTIDNQKVFDVVTKAYPYATLDRETFNKIVSLGVELRMIKSDGEKISLGSRTRTYFVKNISVIPDTQRFIIKNVSTNKVISTLDEKFVYTYIEGGTTFITKGLPWRAISVEKDTVFAEPSEDLGAAVPDWSGEDIPISREIVSLVHDVMSGKVADYQKFLDKDTGKKLADFIDRQKRYFVPAQKSVMIDEYENYAIIYVGLGSLANEFLSRIIHLLILSQGVSNFSIRPDPYSLIVDFGYSTKRPDFKRVFEAIRGLDDIEGEFFIKGADMFRYKFVQVSKLFGIIDKGARITKDSANRVMNFYKDSPVFQETLRDLNKNNFDIESVLGFVKGLKDGSVSVHFIEKQNSPLSSELLRAAYHYRELLAPSAGNDSEISALGEKFKGKSIEFLCSYCGFIFEEKTNADSDREIICRRCKSPLVVINSKEYEEVVRKKLQKKPLNPGNQEVFGDMMKEAAMLKAYGNRAAIALSTYGIGLDTAARILKYVRKDYRMFYIDVLDAQKNFVRNRKFWKLN